MKKIALALLSVLLLVSCTDTETYYVRGTLYTDSTITVPMPGEDLTFTYRSAYSDTLGTVRTDSQGRFGFAYNIGIDPIARGDAKMHIEYAEVSILHQEDTLCRFEYLWPPDTLSLYIGMDWRDK